MSFRAARGTLKGQRSGAGVRQVENGKGCPLGGVATERSEENASTTSRHFSLGVLRDRER